VRLYLLEFDGPETLARGFERVLDCGRAESCALEAGGRRLRFVAPERPAQALLERIYADGGLVWCSRHDLDTAPEPGLEAAS
jgi:hypothetical protein